MSESIGLRKELTALLNGGNAHDGWKEKLESFDPNRVNVRIPGVLTPNGMPITPWQLLEHMRLAQADILEFVRGRGYREREFPREYWPEHDRPAGMAEWRQSLAGFREDFETLVALADGGTDLTAGLPHAPGYSLLRELLLVADHNSYHLGQIGLLEDL